MNKIISDSFDLCGDFIVEEEVKSRITKAVAIALAKAKTDAETRAETRGNGWLSVEFIDGFNTAMNAVCLVLDELELHYLHARGHLTEDQLETLLKAEQGGNKNEYYSRGEAV